jgi:hypothetical protein
MPLRLLFALPIDQQSFLERHVSYIRGHLHY